MFMFRFNVYVFLILRKERRKKKMKGLLGETRRMDRVENWD